MSSTRAPEPIHPRQALLSKPAKSFAVLVALIGVAYLVPGAERFRLLSPKQVEEQTSPAASDSASAPVGEAQLVDETTDRPELAAPQHAQIPEAKPGLPPLSPAAQSKASPLPVEDPSGTALDAFHAALLAVEHKRPGAIARIVHYGDSLLAVDFVTGTLRRKLQERFGDAGHGYMPIANPWPGYFHNDVYRRATTDWTVSRVVGPFAADDLYGLGGVTFIGRSRASRAEYGTSTKSDFGRAVSRFGVQYLEQPDGGVFEISVDKDAQVIRVETAAQTPGLKERMIQVPDGEHRFEFRVVKAPVRAFGTWMERGVPGVVLDSIGIQGGRMRFLDKSDDAHWAAALQMRNPSLVVFQFGLNESADGFAYPMQRYRETSLAVLQQARRALPKASCLVIAPNDTAVKKGTSIVSRGVMPHLVKVQREVSAAAGCAFFNTWEAMGGLG
ncbi:MAG: hypothetical protein MUF54_04310, partial [Polyangiaceae bacterium]|nr:hypothetical protein [Polyangiaceae bacterium]